VNEHPLTATYAGLILFTVGVGLGGAVYASNRQATALLPGWMAAPGSVTDVLTRNRGGRDSLQAIIAFKTPSGDLVSFTDPNPTAHSPYVLHQAVPVVYPGDHPQRAIIDPRPRLWIRSAIGGAGALALMGLGGYVAWCASRLRRDPPLT
jgi:hypothetical protein